MASECRAIVSTALPCVLAVLLLILLSRRSRKNIVAPTFVAVSVTQLKPTVLKPQIAESTTQNAFQVRVCVAGRELEQSYQVQ